VSEKAEVLRVEALSKTFRGRRSLFRPWRAPVAYPALRGIDLSVHRGELVTVLGPNGAGKTTMLKIIASLVTPTSGRVVIEGEDVTHRPQRAKEKIGYVLPDERSFYWRISCRANLRFFAALEGLHGARGRARIEDLARLVGLTEQLDREFGDLSTGQRQRMAIARGLLADPPLLLFDEATRSLDPGRATKLRRLIREVLVDRAKKAVLFTTHDLHEARELSDRVVLIVEGRIAAEGSYSAVEPAVAGAFAKEADLEAKDAEELFPSTARAS
jgi:ABC-2 type transport system ATP-binding protein